jgi:hypothetical protein
MGSFISDTTADKLKDMFREPGGGPPPDTWIGQGNHLGFIRIESGSVGAYRYCTPVFFNVDTGAFVAIGPSNTGLAQSTTTLTTGQICVAVLWADHPTAVIPIWLAVPTGEGATSPPPLSTRVALTNVECDAIGFISKTYSVFYGPALEVAPSGPFSLAGSVSVSGTPTAGRIVVITYGGYEWQITTDGSGNYLLDGIPGGPYVATVVVSGTETSQTRAVTLSSALTGFNFTVTP